MNKKCKEKCKKKHKMKCRIKFLHIFNVIVCCVFIDIVFGVMEDCMSVMLVVVVIFSCEFWLGML